MANPTTTESIEALAAEIGDNIYLDIAKWHLYLATANLHTNVAQQLYPLLAGGPIDESSVIHVLGSIPIKLGAGRREVPLIDLIPVQGQVNLMDILEEFQRKMRD